MPSDDRTVERVAGTCRAHDDARSLRLALLDDIRTAVLFDAHVWLVTDPETEVGSAPLADLPPELMPELPRLIRLKYLTRQSRDRWRKFLAAYGVVDVTSVVFRDRHGCWGFLDLWRTGVSPPFTDAETGFLETVVPTITEALRRTQARTFDEAPVRYGSAGPGVIVLSPELDVKALTAEAENLLRVLLPPDADRRPVPAAAYNVAAQLLAVEAGVDDHPPTARVHLGGGVWLTFRAARMAAGTGAADADIAVTMESTSAPERLALYARAAGLSARETELVERLLAGADTRQVAREMFVSEHTVQDHLKSIFSKTGTRNRRTLLARASGG
jgi:DNA-binding CsgD family transcriptional regulator